MASDSPAMNAATLRGECKLYAALYVTIGAIVMLVMMSWMGVFLQPVFARAFMTTGVISVLAGIGALVIAIRFRRRSIDEQLSFLYSPRAKRAIAYGAGGVAILTILPIILAGPAVFTVGFGLIMLSVPLFAVGPALLVAGSHYRDGTSIHCAACDYEQGPISVEHDLPSTCPECGKRWLVRGGTVVGRRVPDRRFQIAGILLLLMPILIQVASIGSMIPGSNVAIGLASDSSLIELAKIDDFSSGDAWNELEARQLDPRQIAELHAALVEGTSEGEYFSIAGDNWLRSVAKASLLTPEQLVTLLGRRSYSGGASDFWSYIEGVEFSTEQTIEIVRHAIAIADSNRSLPQGLSAWLENAIESGNVPEDLVVRLRVHLDRFKRRRR